MRLPDVVNRLLGREVPTPELERADRVMDKVDTIKITVVPKYPRPTAESRRLLDHARR